MRTRVTASQIAKELGLAQSTVSHVLNGRGDELGIRAATQLRVRETAREMGYLPNVSARAMRSGRFGSAALIQSVNRVFVPASLLLGLTEELNRRHMRLMVAETADAEIGEAFYLPNVMRELSVDGLLINVLLDLPQEMLDRVHALRVPAVWINTNEPADCVFPDDFNGARLATEHLLRLGHRRIAFVKAGPLHEENLHYSVAARRRGYEHSMKVAGLTPQVLEIAPAPIWEKGLMDDNRIADVVQIMHSPERPTAIIAYEKDTALPVLLAAFQMGLKVPGDLSLVMFHHDFEWTVGVSITTVIHNMQRVGVEAAAMLDEKINTPELSLPPRAVPSFLFDGATCGPPL